MGARVHFPDYCKLQTSSNYCLDKDEANIAVELPYPIHKPFKDRPMDSVQKLHHITEQYETGLNQVRRMGNKAKSSLLQQDFNSKSVLIPKKLVTVCELQKNQAPFQCDYNPYYSTGILDTFSFDGDDYLIRPGRDNILYFHRIEAPRKKLEKLNLKDAITEEITGLHCVTLDSVIFILVVHKMKLEIILVEDITKIASCIWSKTFKKPIIRAKISSNKLVGVIIDEYFQLYSISTSLKVHLEDNNLKKVRDFNFYINNSIISLGSNEVTIFDIETFETNSLNIKLDPCDYLVTFTHYKNYIYIASRHTLFRVDIKLGSYEQTSHLMKSTPCYIEIIEFDELLVLCLAGQNDECVLFTGNGEITSLPRATPSLYETFNLCQITKDVLLIPNLQAQVLRSCIGMKLFVDNEDLIIFYSNDLGEIYQQRVFVNCVPDCEEEKQLAVESFFKFIQKLPIIKPVLYATNMTEVGALRFLLHRPAVQKEVDLYQNTSKKTTRFLKVFNEKYKQRNMQSLAANFASIWEDEDDEEKAKPMNVPVVPVDSHDKVYSWIEATSFLDNVE